MTTRHATTDCPTCGKPLDSSTHPEDDSKKPDVGAISICAYCGEVMRFVEGLKLVTASPKDLAKLDAEDLAFVIRTSLLIKSKGAFGGLKA